MESFYEAHWKLTDVSHAEKSQPPPSNVRDPDYFEAFPCSINYYASSLLIIDEYEAYASLLPTHVDDIISW